MIFYFKNAASLLLTTSILLTTTTQQHTANGHELRIQNKCQQRLHIGIQGRPLLENGGFVLSSGQTKSITAPTGWEAGRIWARTGCDGNGNNCVTGQCGGGTNCNGTGGRPPVTLAEMTLDANGQDYYDVSNVDGFNLPVAMYPIQGTVTPRPGADPKYECTTAGCTKDINAVCPSNIEGKNLQVRSDSAVVACKSGCEAHQDDLHCCRGAHDVPENCPSTRTSNWFKMQCPDAYSYAYDDKASTFFCTSRNGLGSSGYHIVFCPSGGSPPTSPGPGGNTRCGCSSCTSSIYNKNAGGHSVVSRIDWLKSNRNVSERQACKQVCGDEFPNVCGRECQPGLCSSQPSNTRCGCSSCTSSVYNKYADGHKVVSRIDWLKTNRNMSETQACRLVCGDEYSNVCGKECNPSRCSRTRLNNPRS